MEGRVGVLMVLSGLWFLPACVPQKYIVVRQALNWSEAQSYCREKYTDLAKVESQKEMNELLASTEDSPEDNLWIGLHNEMTPWKWSMEDDSYFADGNKDFRKWESGEPNSPDYDCALMLTNGFWSHYFCDFDRPFFCSSDSGYVRVALPLSWTAAQKYCRDSFIDLAIIRSQAEQDAAVATLYTDPVWIGLHRGQWKWSDGTPMSFREWNPEPTGGANILCGLLNHGKWMTAKCDEPHFFVCYSIPVKKQVVKMKIIQKDSSGNLEDAAEAILQEMRQKLKQRGLSEDVKLSWRKQPDGRIFVPEEEEEKRKHDEL